MSQPRVHSSMSVFRLGLALLVVAVCACAALVSSSCLLGHADAASDRGPVAAYSFDEGQGATVKDLSGNDHTATIEGADWTTAGRFGGAMEFNGAEEDCLTIADSPDLALSEEFALEAWVRPEGPDYTAPVFFKEGEGGAAYAISFGFAEYSRPEGAISPEPSEEVTVEGAEDVPQYTWSHLALTFDGARMRLYVNGDLVDTAKTSDPISSEAPLELGCSGNPKEAFTERIDEARASLLQIPGIGPWTTEYVAMRALRDPDAFPAGDLWLRRAGATERRAENWRPWRAYAAVQLWAAPEATDAAAA